MTQRAVGVMMTDTWTWQADTRPYATHANANKQVRQFTQTNNNEKIHNGHLKMNL